MDTRKSYICYDKEFEYTDQEQTEGYDYVLIHKVWVNPAERGQGIGRKFMTDALADIRATWPGLPVKLWCEPQDAETDGDLLVAFYESLGFGFTGIGCEMSL